MPEESRLRRERMRSVCEGLSGAQLEALIERLGAAASEWETKTALVQDTDELVARILREAGLTDLDPLHIRRAMCVPAFGNVVLYEGAAALLGTIKALGLRCVILSNTAWRDAFAYRSDFEALGLGSYVDEVITSLDSCNRKPHKAMFEMAMSAAGSRPQNTIMIGDSEERDIVPAAELRMTTLLVTPEKPPPSYSAATAVAMSLKEASELLQQIAAR